MAIKIATDATFEAEVLHNDRPVVVDFWAAWCGPCKLVAPEMEKIAIKYEGAIDVVKVDVDANPGLSRSFNIMSIPTIAFFAPGKQPMGVVGFRPMEQLETQFQLASYPKVADVATDAAPRRPRPPRAHPRTQPRATRPDQQPRATRPDRTKGPLGGCPALIAPPWATFTPFRHPGSARRLPLAGLARTCRDPRSRRGCSRSPAGNSANRPLMPALPTGGRRSRETVHREPLRAERLRAERLATGGASSMGGADR